MPKKKHPPFVTARGKPPAPSAAFTKPAFGYYGAKQRLATRIVKMLPPHHAWVEGFCGSAAISLAKPPAPIEVINDLDGEIVNLFRLLRSKPQAVIEAVMLTPYARAEYAQGRRRWKKLPPLERARRFLAGTMMTVNGTVNGSRSGFSFSSSYTRGGMEARVSRWHNLPERLSQVVERMRNFRVEHRDARKLLEVFLNRPATLVYLDPPYFVKRAHRYVIDANDRAFHEELLRLCCKARCMILLSGYDTPLYNETLTRKKGWKRVVIETHTRDTQGKNYSRSEVLWLNKHFVRAKKLGRVPIRLTKEEKEQNKVNPARGPKAREQAD
jgi:DNA adenine methylase